MISFVGREGGGSGPSISEWVRPNHHQSGLISSLSFLFHFRTFVCVAGRLAFSLTFVRLSGPASRLPSFLLHSLPRGCGCWLCPSQRDLLSDNNTHTLLTLTHPLFTHSLPPADSPTRRLTKGTRHSRTRFESCCVVDGVPVAPRLLLVLSRFHFFPELFSLALISAHFCRPWSWVF